jgi:hypothetical protein
MPMIKILKDTVMYRGLICNSCNLQEETVYYRIIVNTKQSERVWSLVFCKDCFEDLKKKIFPRLYSMEIMTRGKERLPPITVMSLHELPKVKTKTKQKYPRIYKKDKDVLIVKRNGIRSLNSVLPKGDIFN